jgi:DNA-binding transcriptional LysR family regulator
MLRYLKTFLLAAETTSFSAAGTRLGLTQSAVSMQIKRLEEDLGYSLFERSGKSVRLSPQGRAALNQARAVMTAYEDMKAVGAASLLETVKLGAISTMQSSLLPGALRRFKETHKATRINVVPGTSAQLIGLLETHELDVAAIIKPSFGVPSGFVWMPVLDDVYVAIARRGSRKSLKEWADELPFIRYDRRSHGGHLVDVFLRRQNLEVHEELELDEPAVIAKMVAEGLGWAIVPGSLLMLESMRSIQTISLPGSPVIRELGLLARKSIQGKSTVGALADELQKEALRFKDRPKNARR